MLLSAYLGDHPLYIMRSGRKRERERGARRQRKEGECERDHSLVNSFNNSLLSLDIAGVTTATHRYVSSGGCCKGGKSKRVDVAGIEAQDEGTYCGCAWGGKREKEAFMQEHRG